MVSVVDRVVQVVVLDGDVVGAVDVDQVTAGATDLAVDDADVVGPAAAGAAVELDANRAACDVRVADRGVVGGVMDVETVVAIRGGKGAGDAVEADVVSGVLQSALTVGAQVAHLVTGTARDHKTAHRDAIATSRDNTNRRPTKDFAQRDLRIR